MTYWSLLNKKKITSNGLTVHIIFRRINNKTPFFWFHVIVQVRCYSLLKIRFPLKLTLVAPFVTDLYTQHCKIKITNVHISWHFTTKCKTISNATNKKKFYLYYVVCVPIKHLRWLHSNSKIIEYHMTISCGCDSGSLTLVRVWNLAGKHRLLKSYKQCMDRNSS